MILCQEIVKYRFEIWQDMRENPIPEIMDVGFVIEKSTDTKDGLTK